VVRVVKPPEQKAESIFRPFATFTSIEYSAKGINEIYFARGTKHRGERHCRPLKDFQLINLGFNQSMTANHFTLVSVFWESGAGTTEF
jgi:hypothetical protein